MLVQLLSDLHLEFADLPNPCATAADLIVLAGDIHMGLEGVKWAITRFSKPVLYVVGNHEYYEQMQPKLISAMKRLCENTHVQVLENDSVEINGRVFLGATLWTDFALYNSPASSMAYASSKMNDFQLIGTDTDTTFTPADTVRLHQASRNWLTQRLNELAGERVIVVTHHAPSPQSIAARFQGNPLNPAFVNDLDDLIGRHEICAWFHGHTHDSFDYYLRNTRIVCNPRGYYPFEKDTGFMPHKCIPC